MHQRFLLLLHRTSQSEQSEVHSRSPPLRSLSLCSLIRTDFRSVSSALDISLAVFHSVLPAAVPAHVPLLVPAVSCLPANG
jgi:hypothetical protein